MALTRVMSEEWLPRLYEKVIVFNDGPDRSSENDPENMPLDSPSIETDPESITASQEAQAMNVFIPLWDCFDCRVELIRCQVRSALDRDKTCLDEVLLDLRFHNRQRTFEATNLWRSI